MRVEQMKYNFSGSVTPRNLVFSINEQETDISVMATFIKIYDEKKQLINGWSILSKLLETPIVNNQNEEIRISLIDSETKEKADIEITTPVIQWNDKDIDDTTYSNFVEKIVELSHTQEIPGVVEPIEPEEAEQGTGAVADSSVPEPIQFNDEKFNEDKLEYFEKGYQEKKSESGEFVLLYNEEDFLLFKLNKTPKAEGFYFKNRAGNVIDFKKFRVQIFDDKIQVESLAVEKI